MNDFSPIAIVGQGCALPGALTPRQLWDIVAQGKSVLSDAPANYWGVESEAVLTDPENPEIDRTWSKRGGYVKGFDEVFDASGFRLSAQQLAGLDPIFKWGLYAGREALRSAGISVDKTSPRAGVILGNKSYPTHSLADFAENIWRKENGLKAKNPVDPRNRFMSGLPAQILAQAVGFEGGSYCLDVACASSLYAIKLACDRLQEHSADMMLAGGINRADDLFLRVGFCALQAMSRTGQSRPFHRDADGLVPAEGAAFVVLKRLEDAVADDDAILGVIRGVGLSNDGRSRGLLTPSEDGQIRSMKRAYEMAGLKPSDLSLVECHAAGTALGDATEIRSMSKIFRDVDERLPVASLKSNLGHLITVSGVAGLLKIMSAIEEKVRPATLNADKTIDELQSGPLRPLLEPEPWECDGPRRAAINNFGFGGNNAHLIVEEWDAESTFVPTLASRTSTPVSKKPKEAIAVVAISTVAADGLDNEDFARSLFFNESRLKSGPRGKEGRADEIPLDLGEVRFPPLDLQQALPQQLMILRATLQLSENISALDNKTTGILLGMQCDAEVARYLVRWRLGEKEGLIPALKAAGVLGSMPNLVTNRLNSQFDFQAASLTISGEELSGLIALELACRALRKGEMNAAVVGAVDMSCEPVQQAAAKAVLPTDRHEAGDAAVAMVLKRLSNAERDGDTVLAVFSDRDISSSDGDEKENPEAVWKVPNLRSRFGHSHAASGLLQVAAAVESCARRARFPNDEQPAVPWLPDHGARVARIDANTITGEEISTVVEAHPGPAPRPLVESNPPNIHIYSGRDTDKLLENLAQNNESNDGSMRLVIVADGDDQFAQRRRLATEKLGQDKVPDTFMKLGRGVYFGDGSLRGETAFVFTGPAGSYRGMGRELVMAMPELADAFGDRCQCVDRAAGWIYSPDSEEEEEPGPAKKLWGASFLCQVHAHLTRKTLGISPEAAIGFCAGETNALFAMGAWSDFDGLYEDLEDEGIFDRRLGGGFQTVRDAWDLDDDEPVDWQTWRILAPVEDVEKAMVGESRCYITIVNAPGDLVLGGDGEACARVIEKVDRKRARPLGYNIAMHCEATRPTEKLWYDMHHRPTDPVPGVRFYTHATLDHYEVDAENVANALVGQAMGRVDFPRLIRQAWDDGVRVFIEHGPRGGCTRWIQRILGDSEHLAVSLDQTGRDSLSQVVDATARMCAAGVDVDYKTLLHDLQRSRPLRTPEDRTYKSIKKSGTRSFPAHMPSVQLESVREKEREKAGAGEVREGEVREQAVDQSEYEIMLLAPVLPATSEPTPTPAVIGRQSVPTSQLPPKHDQPVQSEPRSAAAQTAVAHDEFLRHRAELHQNFLEQQQRSAQWFLEMAQSGASVEDLPALSQPVANKSATTQPAQNTTQFNRHDLETHASGKISEIFGPLFEQQDDHFRQVRMPTGPLLLVDRVTDVDAEPGQMEKQGVMWTETDVRADAWYMHKGRMPVGITVEAGQADLMLISWMGADFQNRGERVYRLLGCELTFHGELPRPGETLEYEIHIDEHARQGGVHLFFFHYDCRVDGELRLSMRKGQAGFFTDQELAESQGVLWTPDQMTDDDLGSKDHAEPIVLSNARSFSTDDLQAFADGRIHDCFGDGFERSRTHTSSPSICGDSMLFLDRIEVFDPTGGPKNRGYLRAVQDISPDTWFFDGHFKNDPCMPGTLMLEGCTQAMSFYLTSLGFTLDRDGWRFEPVAQTPCQMRCRGQVTPTSKKVVYELFVRRTVGGSHPKLYADVLCTVDGLKAFHCENLGLGLAPDWPMEQELDVEQLQLRTGSRAAADVDGFIYDEAAILACALGRPADAFGEMYRRFDSGQRAPRLPGPPYLLISRIAEIDAVRGGMNTGSRIVAEYDVPDDAWYFDDSVTDSMPFAVLMEVGLQPCGWLASFVGCALASDNELFFRNLDGTGTVFAEITSSTSLLRTETTLKSLSRSGSMIIVGFDVEVYADGERAFLMDTVFGFFPEIALARQAGLPADDETQAILKAPSEEKLDANLPGLGPDLVMFDEITGWWPDGGEAGLGRLRTRQKVESKAWYFKAHFFQDPVQPGSLGVEAMLQLLQVYMLRQNMDVPVQHPRFEAIMCDRPTTWKYRGQVLPENEEVVLDMEILERSEPGDSNAPYAIARASLWVDGTRIYEITDLGMRILSADGDIVDDESSNETTWILDPAQDTWLQDHRPTFTRPALPMMSIADYLAQAVAAHVGNEVVEIRNLNLRGWAVVDGRQQLRVHVEPVSKAPGWMKATLLMDGNHIAAGELRCDSTWPAAPQSLRTLNDPQPVDDPYESGAVFHGSAFQLLKSGEMGTRGSRGVLDASMDDVPIGRLHPALLDAALHVIPHDDLSQWSDKVEADTVAYPHRIEHLTLHGPTPTLGEVRVEVRFDGFTDAHRFPTFQIQFFADDASDGPWADMRLVELLFPKGRIAQGDARERRAFLRDRIFVPGFGLSRLVGEKTRLSVPQLRKNDWFEGTISEVYRVDGALLDQTRQVAIKDHVAQQLKVHPSQIDIDDQGVARCPQFPQRSFSVHIEEGGPMEFVISGSFSPS